MDKIKVCSICKGAGYFETHVEEKPAPKRGLPMIISTKNPCICAINKIIGKKYQQLSSVGDVTKRDVEMASGYSKHKFLVITGNYANYLMLIKSFLVGSNSPVDKNIITNSGDFLEKYYMPKSFSDVDENLSIYDHIYFNRFFLSLNCIVLKPSYVNAVAELVTDRYNRGMSIWLYAEKKITDTKESSVELTAITDKFQTVNADSVSFVSPPKYTKNAEENIQNTLGNS